MKWLKKHWDELLLIGILILAGYFFLKGQGVI